MKVPLGSVAHVRILREGLVKPWGDLDPLQDDLVPYTPPSDEVLRAGLPPANHSHWRTCAFGKT